MGNSLADGQFQVVGQALFSMLTGIQNSCFHLESEYGSQKSLTWCRVVTPETLSGWGPFYWVCDGGHQSAVMPRVGTSFCLCSG